MIEENNELGNKRKKWYIKYLPENSDIKKFNSDQENKLLDVYHECEKEADKYLKKIVKEEFYELLKEIGNKNLSLILPEEVEWISLDEEKRSDLGIIYRESIAKGQTKKSIRDQFKKYLSEGKPSIPTEEIIILKVDEAVSNKKEQLVIDWIEQMIDKKGYISKSEDFENFNKLLGYSSRSFSNKMKEAGLKFVNKKWLKP